MRFVGKLVGIGLIVAGLAGCHRRPPVREWPKVVAPSVLAEASLKYYWQSQITLDEGETLDRIWRLDENLYGLTSGNRLVALDASAGTYKWDCRVASPDQPVFAPCHADGVVLGSTLPARLLDEIGPGEVQTINAVIVNTLTYGLVIDRDTGRRMRKFDFDFAANTPGSSDGTYFFVGAVKGWYYAMVLNSGVRKWVMSTDDLISTRPVCFKGRLYVASQDGNFYAVMPHAEENRHFWTQPTDGPLTGQFVVDDRGCFVPSQDYKLYAFDGAGEPLWTFRTQGPLMQPVQVGQRTVYQFAERDRFYAVDLANGSQRWELPDARQVLATVEAGALPQAAHKKQPYVFVLTDDRHLLMVSETLGDVEVRLPMTRLELFVPNASKPVIYAATREGIVVCITPTTTRYLDPETLKD